MPTAPSMMPLRRLIDPQLAIGSQRLVESCLLSGQQGEGTPHSPRSRATLRQTRSQSFGQLDCLHLPPLSSAVSHPSILCSSNLNPQPISHLSSSSSCLPSSVAGTLGHHSSHAHHVSFQPMDPIPDFSFSDVSKASLSRSNSFGYPFLHTHHTCVCVCFMHPFHSLTYFLICHAFNIFSALYFILMLHHCSWWGTC